MTEELLTDALLREFLLGTLGDDEREEIEGLFLTDSQAREKLLIAEQDLVEDYLESSLNKADLERFLALYAKTEEQRQQLRITKSIKDWALTEGRLTQMPPASASVTIPVSVSVWSRLGKLLGIKPVFIVPIAITIVVAIVLAVVWLNSRTEQRKSLAIEQELAQLNSLASLREQPLQMISVELRPVAVRSGESRAELSLSSGAQVFEFRLPWIQKERFSTYQAKVRHLTVDESFIINNLQPENGGAHAIRLRIPSHLLHRGYYVIELTGLTPNGTAGTMEEYPFSVSN